MNSLLITKYTPIKFNQLKYYDKLINDLKMLISINEINVLLVGEMGVGKSMFLNILINEYYEPSEIDSHVMMINSLSDLNVSQCRNDLKYFCQLKTHQKKKMVCVDDLDLINESNQQVMRNFIDKYRLNVNFICTCSNIKKVIEPIYGRLIFISLTLYTDVQISQIFKDICKNENIIISSEAGNFLKKSANRSVRCILSIIEKCKLYNNEITLEVANQLCTNITYDVFDNYLKNIFSNCLYESSNILLDIYKLGYSVIDIYDELLVYIKISSLNEQIKYNIIQILTKYISIFYDGQEHQLQLITLTNTLIKSIVKV